ncbi:MAG: hypothetical protein RI973_1965 [Bacteroidota bacterium]|jgi:FKBP-type peptidyl-prolyl cis-trans isomerase FkpA
MKYHFLPFLAAAVLLTACAKREQTTPSGYQLINHTMKSGPKPNVGDYAYVHVYVRQDDSLISTSRELGKSFPVAVPDFSTMPEDQKKPGVANPLMDAVGMMSVGDSVTVIIPIDEKMRQMPELKDAKKLAYDIVLAEIKTSQQHMEAEAAEKAAAAELSQAITAREAEVGTLVQDIAKQYKAGSLGDRLKTTDSGLKYVILEEGTGKQAAANNGVDVLYYGILTDGKMFDNAFRRGQPFSFALGQGMVIPGWDEGIALLKEGSKAVLFIPGELGYGEAGAGADIPPNAELIFYVELVKVNG